MRRPLPSDDLDLIVEQTLDVWSTFARARLFITGGTGFIGSWLLEAIQHANRVHDSGIEVVALSRDPDKARASAPHLYNDRYITLTQGDVNRLEAALGHIDVCIHAATDVGDPSKTSDALLTFDTAVLGTRKVLDVAREAGASHFLLTSSGAVYGRQPATLARTPETFEGAPTPTDVGAAYGQGKRSAEWLASAYAELHRIHVSIARIYALLGPGLPLDGPFAAGNFIRDALAGRSIAINGDGRPVRSYLYIADACVWLFRLLASGERGHAYNVGSELEINIIDLARAVERLCGSTASAQPRMPAGVGPPPRYVPDTAKIRGTLNVKEFTSLEAGLAKTINWNRMAATA
jgi:nucleoside-diphosphate-sugar epimerase